MANEFLIESAEDMKKELEFDKFMDEILVTESKNKIDEDKNDNDHRVRNIIREYTERPANRIRWSK